MVIEPKKKSVFKFFLLMLLIFVVTSFIVDNLANIITPAIFLTKYTGDIISRMVMALLVIAVMLISKNAYVFRENKEKLLKSLLIGLPILLYGIFTLLINIINLETYGENFVFKIIGLTLFSLSIGLYEEFLCRGWLQNEFIERFGRNRKQVILSIFLSSLVFGAMHITNLFAGQSLFQTILQVLQATAAGMLLGAVYFRTKNIWSVVILHAFYDFALLFKDINTIKDCTYNTPTTEISIYMSVGTILIIVSWVVTSMYILRKSKINDMHEEKQELTEIELKKEKKTSKILWVVFILIFLSNFIPIEINGQDDYEKCYTYESKEVSNYELHISYYSKYEINFTREETTDNACTDLSVDCIQPLTIKEDFNFEVYGDKDKMKVAIKNLNTKDIVYLDYDYFNFEVIENKDSIIIIVDAYKGLAESEIYYAKIDKASISNDKDSLEKIKESFTKYDVPLTVDLGYITIYNDEYKYPIVADNNYNIFIIDKEDKLFIIK